MRALIAVDITGKRIKDGAEFHVTAGEAGKQQYEANVVVPDYVLQRWGKSSVMHALHDTLRSVVYAMDPREIVIADAVVL